MKPTPTPINEQAIDKAAREGYAVRCKTNGPRVLDQYASPDIMRKQLDDARVIVSAYLDALSVPAEAVVGEPGPIQHVRAHAHMIRCFADEMTDRNWADKALYIKQQAERIMSEIDAALKEGQ